MSVLSSSFVVFRFMNPEKFTPFLDPIIGIRERLAGGWSQPLCPPSLFSAFLMLIALFITSLVMGALWLSKEPDANHINVSNVQYCFVGILLLGTSLTMFVASVSAIFEVCNCWQVFVGGMYISLTVAYVDFGSRSNDSAALGCGIVMLIMVPAYIIAHTLREPGGSMGMSAGLLSGDDHPYKDLKTQHGGGQVTTTTTSV